MEDIVNAGIPKGTAIGHLYGTRGISFATAQKYHDGLGIPLQELMQFVLADRNTRKSPPAREEVTA